MTRATVPATARILVDPSFAVGAIDRRLFGSFVEHMGRCVYTGIYEPHHPTATAAGLRGDVLKLTAELGVTTVRYPGGNFVSGYCWEDGVGPREKRPARLDLAWRSIEPNTFGLHEFMAWTRAAGVEPMLAVNLGTRGVLDAARLVEYCNFPGGTELSELRRANDAGIGDGEPFGIRLWCLGNEMDGPWQIGHRNASEYGQLARETAKAMRLVDPSVELVACGSSNRQMPTFGAWEAAVLEQAYDEVDYISLHAYYEQALDPASFLACALDMDAFIDEVVATADAAAARRRSAKRIQLSFDEWNVWNQRDFPGAAALQFGHAPPLIEDVYNVADAVVVGSLLMSLLRHADRVGIACQAQLANVIAPIRTDPGATAWRQSIFHPFAHTARMARGVVLQAVVTSARHDTPRFGPVDTVDVVVTYDEPNAAMAVFLVNRSPDTAATVQVEVRSIAGLSVREHVVVADDDLRAVNTAADPDRVVARHSDDVTVSDGTIELTLPPASWHAVGLGMDRG